MINNIDNKLNICGIYKINYDNGKIYIGQARSIYARALEHNSKNKYPCDKALKKHNAVFVPDEGKVIKDPHNTLEQPSILYKVKLDLHFCLG